jgi:aminoglycoside phosphotransferase family enzyme
VLRPGRDVRKAVMSGRSAVSGVDDRRRVTRGFAPDRVGGDAPRHAVREALGCSEFHPGRPLDEARETQAAWVFLAGDRAYKVRKPAQMDFPGFGTLEQRRLACLEELRVNRELASSIGLRVRAMVPRLGSMVLADEGARGTVEYAIEMRRFDEARTMASLVQRGLLTDEQVAAVATRLAAFHARAARSSSRDRVLAVMRAGQRNVRELLALTGEDMTRVVQAAARFADAFLLAHGHEIAARADAGFVRDGHGDLRAAHVVFDEPLAIIGRGELDPRRREIDVAQDLAGLVMDLERIGARRGADLLVQCYWDAGGELCSPELLAFYGAQRALVRAKAELLRARQPGDGAAARAAELLDEAQRLAWRARGPMVPVTGGPRADGESPLAAELARRSGFEVLSSSELVHDAHPRACRELGERARELIADGHAVIVDVPLASPRLRAEFAEGLGDGRVLYVCDHHHGRLSAWDELRGEASLPVDPSAGVSSAADEIADWLDARPSAVWPPE